MPRTAVGDKLSSRSPFFTPSSSGALLLVFGITGLVAGSPWIFITVESGPIGRFQRHSVLASISFLFVSQPDAKAKKDCFLQGPLVLISNAQRAFQECGTCRQVTATNTDEATNEAVPGSPRLSCFSSYYNCTSGV
jgi:hypothetical protein